jgi:hypothetical protein
VILSGASDAEIVSGSVQLLNAEVSGASNLKAFGLIAHEGVLDASGASSVQVFVDKSIKAHATGASDVYYKGKPEKVEVKSSGASSIKRKDTPVSEV